MAPLCELHRTDLQEWKQRDLFLLLANDNIYSQGKCCVPRESRRAACKDTFARSFTKSWLNKRKHTWPSSSGTRSQTYQHQVVSKSQDPLESRRPSHSEADEEEERRSTWLPLSRIATFPLRRISRQSRFPHETDYWTGTNCSLPWFHCNLWIFLNK